MKIYLFLKSKILTFNLPRIVIGNFSFDENDEEENKLINIEAKNGEWYIHSTTDVNIISEGSIVKECLLQVSAFYKLQRYDEEYVIYVVKSFDNSFKSYSYDQNINLVVGLGSECNVNYQNDFFDGVVARIFFNNDKLCLKVDGQSAYLNNYFLSPTDNYYLINSGDEVNIYGFRMIFLNKFLLINNPKNLVVCNFESCKLSPYEFNNDENPVNVEVKDVDLYNKEQYFSKAPRIRRQIEEKEITLSPPPKQQGEQKLPLILTAGPMITMGISSVVMLANNVSKVVLGTTELEKIWPTLVMSGTMLISTMLWPTLSKNFNNRYKKAKRIELISKYTKYLETKKEELREERKIQTEILEENLISVNQCLEIINIGKITFWDKRIEQNDFLVVRVGIGDEKLKVKVNYPEEGFTIEEDALKKKTDQMIEEFKYINNVPIGYSLYENKMTAIMGEDYKCYGMVNNIILQLMTYYSYEDIKMVVFTNSNLAHNWKYMKYMNYCFSDDRSVRFFATNQEEAREVSNYLSSELQNKMNQNEKDFKVSKPYYIIITDNYSQIKDLEFTKFLTEVDQNVGFSLLIIENHMSRLPSKCNNFITIGTTSSGILRNSFESQETVNFYNEINYGIDMMSIARKLSNIPIEFEKEVGHLPESISFLEMEKVGKVEQLNIINRWDSNDATSSLKAEIGVDGVGNLLYLDLHEKYHGPHGLIAGMTGSGKSEFIITYILSMCMNYSPDDVAFILIDYKGGGLAGAFEDKTTGVVLPHLAGTITNLDKAEMDRTFISIDSEVKRRQKIFNDARDKLGESTIDIYKYQRFYKEGRISEPVPHLFIVCDEFAELKSQQPDFMNNLISIARIGRSLGVHLILATQKPSGVVNDQIWSNTKFRVCLKVQDESDSKEMLKRPEAASLKNVGRFYLQVGYDELFLLGQSAWCGAKYYPSEKIAKQVDKSINFVDNTGNVVKSIQAGSNVKIEAQGEQLAAIMKQIVEASNITNKKVKRLWLSNISDTILLGELEKKYNVEHKEYEVKAIIGEYDAPEKQEQGLLEYSLNDQGNTVIFGNDEVERESFLNTVVYSICKNYEAKAINIYIVDFGSEQISMFNGFPQIGGIVFSGDDEKFKNLFKLIKEKMAERKKMLIPYGGAIDVYNSKNKVKLPKILFILNNYEGILEEYKDIYDDLTSIGRECERYGIILMITCNTSSTMSRKLLQCFNNKYALHLTDSSDYFGVFDMKAKIKPRDIFGRGLTNNGGIHEFQIASIVDDNTNVANHLIELSKIISEKSQSRAELIPSLPERVTYDLVAKNITTINAVPIGVSRYSLKTIKYDFSLYALTLISANKIESINLFMDSLLEVLIKINGLTIFFVDTLKLMPIVVNKINNGKKINYFSDNFEAVMDKFIEIEENKENDKYQKLYIFYGIEKLKQKIVTAKFDAFFSKVNTNEKTNAIICDGAKGLKAIDYEVWYSKVKNTTDGIWIGKGFNNQQVFRINKISKEFNVSYTNDYGFYIDESDAHLMKVINFSDTYKIGDDEDE